MRLINMVLGVLGLVATVTFAADAPRPNILIILADDLGFADVGFHGSEIKTPSIDALARSGARLEQFYVQPLCSPTRAALLTGRYPMRYGFQVGVVRPWADYGLPLEERTLASALKEAGYETAICGKWHLGHFQPAYRPTQRGFDHQFGHYNGAIDYFTHMRDGGFDWHRDDQTDRTEGYSTQLVGEEAARRIRTHDPARPLFLYVPFNAVHAPHQVPAKYKEPYAALAEPRRTYAGMLAAMDEQIGDIVAALKEKKMYDDTLIIFSSDNGGPAPGRVTSNGPLRAAKGTVYEGGTRVAACASWSGRIPAGGTVDQPLHIVDLYPTLLKLAGATLTQPLPIDGRDALAALTAGQRTADREILLNAAPSSGAIRVGDWKLVINGQRIDSEDGAEPPATRPRQRAQRRAADGEAVELFNLASDIGEKNNLAGDHPDKVKELRARYDEYAKAAVAPKTKPKPADFVSPAVWGESK